MHMIFFCQKKTSLSKGAILTVEIKKDRNVDRKGIKMEKLYFRTIRQAAKEVGLTDYFVRSGVLSGKIPAITCGVKYMVNMPGFYNYLKTLDMSDVINGEDEDK